MKSGPIRIISDGMGPTTLILDANNTEIQNVTSVTIWLEANEINRADITVIGVVTDIHAEMGDVEMLCPVCAEIQTHTCQPNTMGGM